MRRTDPYEKKFPERIKAGKIIERLIKKGKLIRPHFCSVCHRRGIIHGHHEDYSKPTEIIWICRSCHTTISLFKRYDKSLEEAFYAIKNPLRWTYIRRGVARGIWWSQDNFRRRA